MFGPDYNKNGEIDSYERRHDRIMREKRRKMIQEQGDGGCGCFLLIIILFCLLAFVGMIINSCESQEDYDYYSMNEIVVVETV